MRLFYRRLFWDLRDRTLNLHKQTARTRVRVHLETKRVSDVHQRAAAGATHVPVEVARKRRVLDHRAAHEVHRRLAQPRSRRVPPRPRVRPCDIRVMTLDRWLSFRFSSALMFDFCLNSRAEYIFIIIAGHAIQFSHIMTCNLERIPLSAS